MCLVESKGSPKPVASCAMPVAPNQEIFTDTPLVKKARESVLEFLLMNHPLDCPICDQGGECDLQDQAMEFGGDSSRFYHTFKRSVEDKNCGPLVKTIMTRCIHCTRCVRFSSEVAGVGDLGTTGRGVDTEIGFYTEKLFDSELSGNVIDLCPVGALTNKPYAFKARPWELNSVDTVDFADGMGSNIKMDSKGLEVLRVTPRHNDLINEEWISDKTRFSYDGLKRQRLDKPFIKRKHLKTFVKEVSASLTSTNENDLVPVSWELALNVLSQRVIHARLNKTQCEGISGSMMEVETLKSFEQFCRNTLDSRPKVLDTSITSDLQDMYTFNASFEGIGEADLLITVGTNIRLEAPVLNTRVRKQWLHDKVKIAHIGPAVDLTYPVNHLSLTLSTLVDIAHGRHPFCQDLYKAEKPLLMLSPALFRRDDKKGVELALEMILEAIPNLQNDVWNGLAMVDTNTALSELGFETTQLIKDHTTRLDLTLLLNPEDRVGFSQDVTNNLRAEDKLWDTIRSRSDFLIYVGHHGTSIAAQSDVILPSLLYIEKDGHHINMEGRIQKSAKVCEGPGIAKNEADIFNVLNYIVNRSIFTTSQLANESLLKNSAYS
jgi:NADH dehydrogenase (ubiquinone) Fe-S protein 1